MTEHSDDRAHTEPRNPGDPAASPEGSPSDANPARGTHEAREELFEAIEHFRNAATLFFERASNDPAVRNAANEAERVFQRIGERAEPLARQVTGELTKLTRRISESIEGTVGGRRKPPKDG